MIRRTAWSVDRDHRQQADTEHDNVFDHDKKIENFNASNVENDPPPNALSQTASSDATVVTLLLVVITTILLLLVVAVCTAVYYYRLRLLSCSQDTSSTKENDDALPNMTNRQSLRDHDGSDEERSDHYDCYGYSNFSDDETQDTPDSRSTEEATISSTSISSTLAVAENEQPRATPNLTGTVVDSATEQDATSSLPSSTLSRNSTQDKPSKSGKRRAVQSMLEADSFDHDDTLIFPCDVSPFDYLYHFNYNDDQTVMTAATTNTFFHDTLQSFYRSCGSQPRSSVRDYIVNDDTTFFDDTTYNDDSTKTTKARKRHGESMIDSSEDNEEETYDDNTTLETTGR